MANSSKPTGSFGDLARGSSPRTRAKERYRNAGGKIIPSVTTALSILNKPAMIRWANRLGLEGIDLDRYTDELADIGTLTHYLILCWLREEPPDTSSFTPIQVEAAERCFKKYQDWESRNPVRPIMVEQPLVSEFHQYGGTPDLYALCDKDLLLADFKTGKAIFPEMVYQVSAYRELVKEAGYRVSRVVILRLGRDDSEGAEEKTITEAELITGFDIFMRCLEIYRLSARRT